MSTTAIPELSWLTNVEELGPRLTLQGPIYVRHFVIDTNSPPTHPECHPYCEIGMHVRGSGVEYVEREQAVRRTGDLFCAGPGVPHWFRPSDYPIEGTAIYFLPSLLCDWGPIRDGIHILRRFTARQGIASRIITPPDSLRRRADEAFGSIRAEFDTKALGHEIRLRTLLMDLLVELIRWEEIEGSDVAMSGPPLHWEAVNRALHYLREHFAERVYAHDVAEAAGISETTLRVLFRQALGTPWSRYIQGYRIQQAIALLNASDCNVTEAALSAGFESLSHFNATFRTFMGVSPSQYLKSPSKT